jgi:hypothetical protein
MSNVIEFPPSDRPVTKSEIDKHHSEAFRTLRARFAISTAWVKLRTI